MPRNVMVTDPITCTATAPPAKAVRPCCSSVTTSTENVEKVVRPPQNSRMDSGYAIPVVVAAIDALVAVRHVVYRQSVIESISPTSDAADADVCRLLRPSRIGAWPDR